MKTDLFQSCGHGWVFQIFWHIECRTFTALCFRIWNSSTGIPSPPLVVFVVMLLKAHLTSHSMSGSWWEITPLWLSGLWRSSLYSSSVYSCHLFLISSASVRVCTSYLQFCEAVRRKEERQRKKKKRWEDEFEKVFWNSPGCALSFSTNGPSISYTCRLWSISVPEAIVWWKEHQPHCGGRKANVEN